MDGYPDQGGTRDGLGIHMGETWDLVGKDMRNTWERHEKNAKVKCGKQRPAFDFCI